MGGLSVPEGSVAEPAEPVKGEPEAASRRRSLAISCSVRETAEGVDANVVVEALVPVEAVKGGPEAASRRRSLAISCSVRETAEGVDADVVVEALVPVEERRARCRFFL